MAHVLVTGGAGFIGRTVVRALIARGDRVTVLDDLSTGNRSALSPDATLVVGDVTEPGLVGRLIAGAGIEAVIHLAAIASVARTTTDWSAGHRVNVGGSVAVLEAARDARPGQPVPVVYASSAAVYGACPAVPLVETAPTRPLSAYGADKLASETHARIGGALHGVPTLGVRLFNVYGPGQDPASPYSGVISLFADRLNRGEAVTIHGDGQQSRDFVFVEDAAGLLIAGLTAATTEAPVVNGCTGVETTIRDLVDHLARATGHPARITTAPSRPGDIRRSLGDPTGAAQHLGRRATTPLAQGLARTLAALAPAD